MKKRKAKWLAMLLSCLVLVFMLSVPVFAAEDAATPQTGRYITKETKQEDLDAWAGGEGAITISTEGDVTTVTLLKDFKLGKTGNNANKATTPVNFGKYPDTQDDKMVLDLNGHLLSSDTMVINVNCDLTIKDSAGGGKVYMDTSDSSASAFEAVVNQRKLTIEGGTYEAKVHSLRNTAGVIGSAVADVETVVTGGEFIGSGSAVNVSSGTTTITGGKFTGGAYGVVAQKDAVVNFPADSQAEITSAKFPIVVGKSGESTGQVNIEGGRFDGTDASSLVGQMGGADKAKAVKIEGGIFTQDPAAYTGELPVAQVGEPYMVGEKPIQEAAKSADPETTVTVTKGNVELTDVPDGVVVENKGSGNVSVNGDSVASGETQTAHTHQWGEVSYSWSADYKTCSAQRVCAKDTSHAENTAAAVTAEETKAPTCTEKGEMTYKAVFAEVWALEQTATQEIEAAGHSFEDGKCTVCGYEESKPEEPAPEAPKSWWVLNAAGWWYDNGDGTWPISCWQLIDGSWYVFDENGYMCTGWYRNHLGDWFYLKDNGAMATGWEFVGGSWYYFYDSGVMAAGWLNDHDIWYYLREDGAMQTGWHQNHLGDWFYLKDNGAMATGWEFVEGNWYYFYDNGVMAEDTCVDSYYVNESGIWVS